jgi:hypothetical protein
MRTPQRRVDALLMGGVLELLVGRESIVFHAPRPVETDDLFETSIPN